MVRPDTVATSAAMVVMSYSVLVLLLIGALAVVPLALDVREDGPRRARVMRPLVLVMAGAGIFVPR